jgi:L,D-transpeptidase ErfK/SrfK
MELLSHWQVDIILLFRKYFIVRKEADLTPSRPVAAHISPQRRRGIPSALRSGSAGFRAGWACVLAGVLIWAAGDSALAQTFTIPPAGDNLVGRIMVVGTRYQDTLSDVARAHDIGFDEIASANPAVDHWLPGAGTRVIVPGWYILPDTPHTGIVLNLPEMRLYYYPPPQRGKPAQVMTFPVGIGRMDWSTPLGLTRVSAKIPNPAWYPPVSIRDEHAADGASLPVKIDPGPDNPLGEFALQLALPGYLIHGTNRPYGVGMRVSHGCVRLYPEDISRLFSEVRVGTPVRIINQPYKAGWHRGVLYFEAHPPLEEDRSAMQNNLTPAIRVVLTAARQRSVHIDWDKVTRAAAAARGIPVAVSY